jgi:hypothetical protein
MQGATSEDDEDVYELLNAQPQKGKRARQTK